jgi:hypothetical protein
VPNIFQDGPLPIWTSAYNIISVGRSDGGHIGGTAEVDDVYNANRTRPDIVTPLAFTSWASPLVAGAAAVLVETGRDNPGL